MYEIKLTSCKVLNSWYMDHLSVSSYTRVTNFGPLFMAEINWYFGVVSFLWKLRKEYLNMATFRISVLLLIKSCTFWDIERLRTSSYTGVIHY